MDLQRLNYGMALANSDQFQIVDTVYHPGIRDDWSYTLSEPFIYYVAPHQFIDKILDIYHLSGPPYLSARAASLKTKKDLIRKAILDYHGIQIKIKKHSWAD